MFSKVRVMVLVGADSSSALLADAGEAGVPERGERVAEVDVVLLLAVRQPRVRPLALGEPVHEGIGGGERGAGLLALVVEGVGAGSDRGRQRRRGGRPVPGDVTGPFREAGRRLRGAVVEWDHRLAGEDPGVQLVVTRFGGGPGGRGEPGTGLPAAAQVV